MSSACVSLIDDIEDMVSSSETASLQRSSNRPSIIPRARKRKDLTANEELQVDSSVKFSDDKEQTGYLLSWLGLNCQSTPLYQSRIKVWVVVLFR
ncbi:Threonylcarbamoyladenosine tRNA methylthiotransferase [Bagarius yarrelli]|uniref:Threonylcarbamoyladenosine tRNA methylthiotransferase n=1 Tax=Bagarius yarrelli TaxID=175774 RepID=A0A556TUQ5_BAGYA|nr:Threonylcarbamoyladenosine tRNA methylthiotransferase [Bagarius yarrelli]